MNFNVPRADYAQFGKNVNEVINLYGIPIRYLIVSRINKDDLVFGDWSHIKTDPGRIYELYALPEVSESWDNIASNFSNFGMLNVETINLFVSRKSIDEIYENISDFKGFSEVIGNLVVMPNNRIMEITDFQFEVPGSSNLFAFNNTKNVYKMTCKTHDVKLFNEINNVDITSNESSDTYEGLDKFFMDEEAGRQLIDYETEVNAVVQTKRGKKPLLDKTQDNVFGTLG
jgi:hypothetical protein